MDERVCTCGHVASKHQYLNGCSTCGKENCPSFERRTEDNALDIPDWVNAK